MSNEGNQVSTPIITTPGRYRTRGGDEAEVIVLVHSGRVAVGYIDGDSQTSWDVRTGKNREIQITRDHDITEKIDGGAE